MPKKKIEGNCVVCGEEFNKFESSQATIGEYPVCFKDRFKQRFDETAGTTKRRINGRFTIEQGVIIDA